MTALETTVVICTRHRPDDLRRSLESIAQQEPAPIAMLVVDDSIESRREETRLAVTASGVDARIVTKDEPGLPASRNLALDLVETPLITYFDDDIVLAPGYLRAVLDAFEGDPGLDGAGGIVDDDHVYGHHVARAIVGLPGRPTGRVLPTGYTSPLPRHSASVEHLIGCNMTFKVDVLRRYRFDATRFAGYALGEDAELTFRMTLDGRRLAVVERAHLRHLTRPVEHGRAWGRRELAVRPLLAQARFSRPRFLLAAAVLIARNALTNPQRCLGNLEGVRDALSGRQQADAWDKPVS
jgi:glycosyltransferase involved in cell wall biosynthesis